MKLWSKITSQFRRGKLDAEMAEEMRLHLERRVEENVTAGMSAAEARYAARREFGIRLALGALPRQIMHGVLRQGMRRLALGGVLGLALAFALARVGALTGSNLLYHVSPRDPALYAVVLALLGATTLIACVVPAWRATKVDPVIALRAE